MKALMKMNNKGFTIVEIVMSFSLIMILSMNLFMSITTYKKKQDLESFKSSLASYKMTLVYDIQKDINEKSLTSITESSGALTLRFENGLTKELKKISDTKISYDGVAYEVPDKDLIKVANISLIAKKNNDFIYGKEESEGKSDLYKITIKLELKEYTDDYLITIPTIVFKQA